MRAHVPVELTLTQSQYQTSGFLIGVLAKGYQVGEVPMAMRLRGHGSTKKGNNLVFGTRYARVLFGTWMREWVWAGIRGRRPRKRSGDARPGELRKDSEGAALTLCPVPSSI